MGLQGSVYLGEIDADDIQVANDDRLFLSALRSSLIAAHGGTSAAHTLRIHLHLRGNSLCVAGVEPLDLAGHFATAWQCEDVEVLVARR